MKTDGQQTAEAANDDSGETGSQLVNPFEQKKSAQFRRDLRNKCLVLLATYFILLCTFLIFKEIVVNGVPVLANGLYEKDSDFTDFFTESPEILYTIEDVEGERYRMSVKHFRVINSFLVVDSDPYMEGLIRKSVGGILSVDTGSEAQSILHDAQPFEPRMIILNYEDTGSSYLEEIANDERWADVPIVIASAPESARDSFGDRVHFVDAIPDREGLASGETQAFLDELSSLVSQHANEEIIVRNDHTYTYSAGGILGPLMGTIFLVIICIIVALIIGIASAIYLNEYAKAGPFISLVRLANLNLSGVPSVVFGLFGLSFFCYAFPWVWESTELEDRSLGYFHLFGDYYLSFQGFGTSLIAGGLTLAVMIIPVIITACEESLKAVPMGFREASLAMGATRWQTIRKAVLPYAFPGMMTASVLGITRVAGETAPIMFTAAVAHRDQLPWENVPGESILEVVGNFFSQMVQAMPYHIYTVSARIPQSEFTRPMQYGSVLVFMIVVGLLASLSIWLRMRIRKKLKW